MAFNNFLTPADREQAAYAGLMQLASGLMQGGAATTQPGGAARGLGLGLGGFSQGYQGSINNALQSQVVGAQLAKAKREEEQLAAQQAAIQGMFRAPGVQYAMAGNQQPGPTTQAAAKLQPPIAQIFPGADVSALQSYATAFPQQFSQVVGQRLTAEQKAPTVSEFYDDKGQPYKAEYVPGRGWQRVGGSKTPDWMNPAYVDVQKQIRAAGKPETTIDMRAETQEAKDYGSDLVKEYASVRERASAAEEQRNQIRMARAFADTDQSGRELPSVLQQKVGNAAAAMGFNVESPMFKSTLGRISDGQSFNGVMQNLVLTKMQAQKGPQTENDAKRIEMTLASLGNTPEARDFLLRASDALSFEDVLKRQHYDEHKDKKMTFKGAATSWTEFRNSVPFMGISPNTQKPVFFAEFYEANRDKPLNQVVEAWRKQYGR